MKKEYNTLRDKVAKMSPEKQRAFLSGLGINLSADMNRISLNKESVLKPIEKP